MKTLSKITQILIVTVAFSLMATVSYGAEAHSNGFSIKSSGIIAPIVTNEAAWEQWPNYEGLVSYNGSFTKGGNYDVVATRANGPVNMKRGNFVGWPSNEEAFTADNDQMLASDSVRYTYGTIGSSVMKESTWQQWPEYDESMTE